MKYLAFALASLMMLSSQQAMADFTATWEWPAFSTTCPTVPTTKDPRGIWSGAPSGPKEMFDYYTASGDGIEATSATTARIDLATGCESYGMASGAYKMVLNRTDQPNRTDLAIVSISVRPVL